jgi:glycosyltransferase involved in cell wall biosynthesis
MKNLLMICHDFPPTMVGGVIRPLKFAKYLPEYGWRPIVLTCHDGAAVVTDDSLLEEIPPQVEVVRTPPYLPKWLFRSARAIDRESKEPGDGELRHGDFFTIRAGRLKSTALEWLRMYALVPDRAVLWKPSALKHARQIFRSAKIDAVYTTAPPNSAHLVGLALKKRFGVPWVADFRDHWLGNVTYYAQLRNRLRRFREARMEGAIVRAADWIVSATEEATREFQERYSQEARKFQTLTNGYDDMDFLGTHADTNGGPVFRIRSFGSVGKGRNIAALLSALKSFTLRNPDLSWKIEFFGLFGYDRDLWRRELGEHAVFAGNIPHRQVPGEMRKASLLLIVQGGGNSGGSARFAVPGKLYECGRAGVPVFGLVDEGPTGDIIDSYGLGYVCRLNDEPGMVKILEDAMRRWQADGATTRAHVPPQFQRFERRVLTGQLAVLLNGGTVPS